MSDDRTPPGPSPPDPDGGPTTQAEAADAEDVRLVGRVLAGEREAYRGLVERHQAVVYRLVGHLARWAVPAEDLAQEVFVAAYAGLFSFDPARGRFVTWLLAIARHRALNAAKKPRPVPVAVLPVLASPTTPFDAFLAGELAGRLERALAELPAELGTTFVLKELVGLETDEIAALDAVEPGTVRARLSRARGRLRAVLGEEP